MLDLLAGPFAFKDADGTTLDLDTNSVARWDDGVGFLSCIFESPAHHYTVSQLDGLTHRRAFYLVKGQVIQALPGKNLLIKQGIDQSLVAFDPASGTPGATLIESDELTFVLYCDIKLSDRYLHVTPSGSSATISGMTLEAPDVLIPEHTLTAPGRTLQGDNTSSPTISAISETLVSIAFRDGTIIGYDAAAKAETGERRYVPSNHGCWYSPKFGVYIVLGEDNRLSVYASTPRPAAMSGIAAEPELTQGRRSLLSVQLTGSEGEPCPGERVVWAINSGPGVLSAIQSITGADGFATVGYYAPLDLTGAAAVVIATVDF